MLAHLTWQKSSFSGGTETEDCVELAATPTSIHLRESDAPTTTLATTRLALKALLTGLKQAR